MQLSRLNWLPDHTVWFISKVKFPEFPEWKWKSGVTLCGVEIRVIITSWLSGERRDAEVSVANIFGNRDDGQ